jgi:hypothetical protein
LLEDELHHEFLCDAYLQRRRQRAALAAGDCVSEGVVIEISKNRQSWRQQRRGCRESSLCRGVRFLATEFVLAA